MFLKRDTIIVAIILAVVVGMLATGKWISIKQNSSRRALMPNPMGSIAPDFTLPSVDGQKVKLSDYRGKAVLLNFWATWCSPCKVEIPWFLELEKQYGPQGLVVIGVSMDDDSKEQVAKFSRDMKIDYPVLVGTDDVADTYGGVDGLPTTFYIGRDGKIVKRMQGLGSHSEIEDSIRAALAQNAPAATTTGAKLNRQSASPLVAKPVNSQ
jgi:peroxiredoxin